MLRPRSTSGACANAWMHARARCWVRFRLHVPRRRVSACASRCAGRVAPGPVCVQVSGAIRLNGRVTGSSAGRSTVSRACCGAIRGMPKWLSRVPLTISRSHHRSDRQSVASGASNCVRDATCRGGRRACVALRADRGRRSGTGCRRPLRRGVSVMRNAMRGTSLIEAMLAIALLATVMLAAAGSQLAMARAQRATIWRERALGWPMRVSSACTSLRRPVMASRRGPRRRCPAAR